MRTAGLAGLRGQLLTAIRTAAEPLGVDDLAAQFDVHRNTVRANLAVLEAKGLVEPQPQPTGGKGRPRQVYSPTADGARIGDRNFLLLAEVLVEQVALASERPVEVAREAGRRWGVELSQSEEAGRRAHSAPRRFHDALDAIGFQPDRALTARTRQFRLLNCPFREAVDRNPEVVCAVHLGLTEGLLAGGGTPRDVHLEPTSSHQGCLVQLGAT